MRDALQEVKMLCGIIGYIGSKNNIGEILLNGLKNLEYRG
jgi:glucosamine 6-phosphate synthetase-like amidotransferase/phosphosugar isomerase protein